jgi:hypothetical protein
VIVQGYYGPMMHSHATVESVLARVTATADGSANLDMYSPEHVGVAMAGAHAILLYTLDVQAIHFGLKFDLDEFARGYARAWNSSGDIEG